MPQDSPQPLLQFGTRSLLIFTALASLLFALAHWLGAVVAITTGLVVLLVAAHVVGNHLGKRIFHPSSRAAADDHQPADQSMSDADLRRCREQQLASAEQLRQAGIGWPSVAVTVLGALLASGVTIAVLWRGRWTPTTGNTIVICAVSAAVLGGFLGFMLSSFAETFFAYWRLSTAELRRLHGPTRWLFWRKTPIDRPQQPASRES